MLHTENMMARFAVDVRYSTYRISRVGTRVKLPRKRPAKPHVIFSVIPDHLYPFEGETFVEEADLAAYTARWLQLADVAPTPRCPLPRKRQKPLKLLARNKNTSVAKLNVSSKTTAN